MSVHFGRLLGSCLCVLTAAAVASPASAQVTLRLTTPQGSDCTVTTDAQGLTLVPGTTELKATGVTFSGAACSGTAPPQPDGFALTAPATVTTGTPFSVSWTVTGATACTGTATSNGNPVNLAGWTDSTSATSPRSVTAPSDGTYVLKLKCSNAGGNANSLPATVTASAAGGGGGDDNCPNPASRLTTSSISYVPSGVPPTRTNVDMTSWDNIWGHATASDGVVPWPGRANAAPVILNFGKTQYLAAKFHVPQGTAATTYGWITHTDYNYGQDLTASISTACGDFNPVNPLCLSVTVSGQNLVPWRVPPGNFCPLTPGQDYFLNIKMTDPTRPSSTCATNAALCAIGTANNFHNP
jgi:hypothetical protein